MARGKNSKLQGGRELSYVTQKDALLGSMLQKMITAINTVADHTGTAAVGKTPPPPPIGTHNVQGAYDADTNTLTVKGDTLHYTMVHNSPLKKGIQYFSEISTDPNFSNAHPIAHGASRSAFLSLPKVDENGSPQAYYLRSFPQNPGGDPQKPTVYGGLNGPTKIVFDTTSDPIGGILQSQASGTARVGQGAKGLGTVLDRPAPGPKRNLSPTRGTNK